MLANVADSSDKGTELCAADCALLARPLGDWVEELAALAFRAACLLSAVVLRRCSAEEAPLLTRLRHDGRFEPRSFQASTGISKLFRLAFEAVFDSSKFALSFCQFAV